MKRISLIFAFVSALILSLGISAFAGTGAVSISQVDGIFGTDSLNCKLSQVRFVMKLNNDIGKKCDVSGGWRVYTPDGAAFTATTLDTLPPYIAGESKFVLYFDITFGGQFTGDGAPADTVGYLGAGTPGKPLKQLPVGFNDTAFAVTVTLGNDPVANNGKHLCIDSSFWGIGGTWVWVTDLDGDGLPDSFTPTWSGEKCYTLYNVPNLPPSISNCVPTIPDQKWCSTFTYDFNATDPEQDGYTFELVSGPGSINAATGVWTYAPTACGDAGPKQIVVRAKDTQAGAGCTVSFNVTNAAPAVDPSLCGKTVTDKINQPVNVTLAGSDPDGCGTLTFATTTPGASVTGNVLTFTGAAEGTYPVEVTVSDGCATSQPCIINFNLLAGGKYWVTIEKTHKTIQGGFEYVDVNLSKAFYDALLGGMGGFNFLIAYDNSALSLQSVLTDGSAIFTPKPNGCGWEYFTYRFGADGNCTGGCPSGLVRVVGIAETNNGANHPGCDPYGIPTGITEATPAKLFTLKFLVSNDHTLNCQYVPVRFFWIDCLDNSISSALGNDLYVENDVYEYDYKENWGNAAVPDAYSTLPGYYGILKGSCVGSGGKTVPHEDIDFYNGGIDIACSDSIDARGDVNLNGIGYEIADAVLFSRYFVYGLPVFTYDPDGPGGIPMGAGQIAATDVNADGLVLTVADLVYLIRVVIGDALPYAKLTPINASYTHADNGTVSVDGSMGAALVVVKGDVKPELLAKDMSIMYSFDGTNTRILVYPNLETMAVGFSGDFLNVRGEIVSIEMASADGAPVAGKLIPSNYALNQNYPNPFNPSTKISFALPHAGEYTLTIYNVTGQKVAEFNGSAQAGNVDVVWNASGNASGIYFYKLNAGTFSETKKMVLLK